MQLHANDGTKWVFGSQQHSTSHSGSQIDEGELIDRRDRTASPPARQDGLEDRWRDGIVGRCVLIVPVAALQMSAGNQPAGSHTKLQVKWMPDQPILDR